MQAKDRIILALDVDSEAEALGFVGQLAPFVGAFKVGMQLFNSTGPSIVNKINELGGRVFVDLKFHDIPNTVAAAGRVMTRLNCHMFNVHAAGGRVMLENVASSERRSQSPGPNISYYPGSYSANQHRPVRAGKRNVNIRAPGRRSSS